MEPHRLSLQLNSPIPNASALRPTQSAMYGKKKRVRIPPPQDVIVELESPVENEAVNVHVGEGKTRSVRSSVRSAVVNQAFEGQTKVVRNDSANNSTHSSIGNPSISNLSVVREQYCCCSRWSPCERTLFATVGVLVFIIIILVITVGLVASRDGKSVSTVLSKVF